MAKLQQLADMKSQGMLSEEEFAAMKAKLLGIDSSLLEQLTFRRKEMGWNIANW